MLEWPPGSEAAQAFLLRPVQDLEVYIEDGTQRALYRLLLRRLLPDNIRILDVIPLNGKDALLQAAANHLCESPPALFIVDGDFEWVRGEPAPVSPLVYRLEGYSIENLLVDESAVVAVVVDEAAEFDEDEAGAQVDFSNYCMQLRERLKALLSAWAAVNKLCPELATVGIGLGRLVEDCGGRLELSPGKIEQERASLKAQAVAICGEDAYAEAEDLCATRLRGLRSWTDAVPGRQILLPLVANHIAGCAGRRGLRHDSLRFRLARHSNHESLRRLVATAVERVTCGRT